MSPAETTRTANRAATSPGVVSEAMLRLITVQKCCRQIFDFATQVPTFLVSVSLSRSFVLSPAACMFADIHHKTVVPFIRGTEANRLLVAVMNKLIFNGLRPTKQQQKMFQHDSICLRFTDTVHSTSSFNLMLHANPNGFQMDL